MRDDIKYLDSYDAAFRDGPNSEADDLETVGAVKHISIGSKQTSCSFDALEHTYANDPLFTRFRIRLCQFLEHRLALQNLRIKGGEQVSWFTELS